MEQADTLRRDLLRVRRGLNRRRFALNRQLIGDCGCMSDLIPPSLHSPDGAPPPENGKLDPLSWPHYLYAVAMLLTGYATFGVRGAIASALILAAWAYVFTRRSRVGGCLVIIAIFIWSYLLSAVFFTRLVYPPAAARRNVCRNNLRQIGVALYNYHDAFGSFPPAVTYDSTNRPMHSWRALILPYLDDADPALSYDLDEPWDGPNNAALADQMPRVFRCPTRAFVDDAQNVTSYVAVTGDGTVWPEEGTTSLRDMTDGSWNTILLVECDARNTAWTKPEDISFDEALDLLTDTDALTAFGHHEQDYFYKYPRGRFALFCDGAAHQFSPRVSKDWWRVSLLRDDGLTIEDVANRPLPDARDYVIRTRNWIRLGCFVIMALFPLPWVWLNPTSRRQDVVADSPK